MLVLSRKCEESFVIGEGEGAVTVTVLAVGGDRVRLGVTAARHVPVRRGELAPKQGERDAAAGGVGAGLAAAARAAGQAGAEGVTHGQ